METQSGEVGEGRQEANPMGWTEHHWSTTGCPGKPVHNTSNSVDIFKVSSKNNKGKPCMKISCYSWAKQQYRTFMTATAGRIGHPHRLSLKNW